MAEVVVGELRNHATRRSDSREFRTSLEARSEVEKKTALVTHSHTHDLNHRNEPGRLKVLTPFKKKTACAIVCFFQYK